MSVRSAAAGYGSIDNILKMPSPFTLTDTFHLQEKIDGSQFRFGVFKKHVEGGEDAETELRCWSRNNRIDITNPCKMFVVAVETAKRLYLDEKLPGGYTFCAEAMAAKRHNILEYERAPLTGMVLFDVYNDSQGCYSCPDAVLAWGEALGLEVAPYKGSFRPGETIDAESLIASAKAARSVLGGGPVEGFVLKAATQLNNKSGSLFRLKVINPAFSETKVTKRTESPQALQYFNVGQAMATPIRWEKAMTRLAEEGTLKLVNADIPLLIREVIADVEKEELDVVKALLWASARKKVLAGAVDGLAAWYQGRLYELERAVEDVKKGLEDEAVNAERDAERLQPVEMAL